MVSQYSTPQTQTHSTSTSQSEGRSLPYRGAVSGGGNQGGRGWGSNSVNNTPPQLHCLVCESNDHNSSQCPSFVTPSARRAELSRTNKCPDCAFRLKNGNTHHCLHYVRCNCGGRHRKWLCTDINNNVAVSQGQNLSLGANGTGSQDSSSLAG